MRYLISKNGQPETIILADTSAIADHCAAVLGGTARALADGEIVELPAPPTGSTPAMSKLAFLRRFTAAERIAIRASPNPVVVDFMGLLDLADEVRTDDPDTSQGVQYLEVLGLLSPGRAVNILTPFEG